MINKLIAILLTNILTFVTLPSLAFTKEVKKNAALVKIAKGKVFKIEDGKSHKLKKGDWIKEGSVVKTEAKSFASLVYTDKSSMNVGPNSEMKIEQFNNKDPGLINVIQGKIRSQVSKDYLQINKDSSKLLIKTKTAVMGVRGTEFIVDVNKNSKDNSVNTSMVLIEGEVVMRERKKNEKETYTHKQLDAQLNKFGFKVKPNEAVAINNREIKSGDNSKVANVVKVALSVQQATSLAKGELTNAESAIAADDSIESKDKKSKDHAKVNIVPPGLDKSVVESEAKGVDSTVEKMTGEKIKDINQKIEAEKSVKAEEQKNIDSNEKVKREVKAETGVAAFDLKSGTFVKASPDAVIDQNTGRVISEPNVKFEHGSQANFSGGIKFDPEGSGNLIKEVVSQDGSKANVVIGDPSNPAVMKQVNEVFKHTVHNPGSQPVIQGPAPASINGNPMGPPLDSNGNPLPPPLDENGNPMGPPLDENGNPMGPPPEMGAGIEPPPINDVMDNAFTQNGGAGAVLQNGSVDNFNNNVTAPPPPVAGPGNTRVNFSVGP